jgi:cobalt-zinc-cadmium efflux system outer membrane protein
LSAPEATTEGTTSEGTTTGDAAAQAAAAELDSLVALALARAPGLRRREAQIDAMREDIPAAGALPDPMIGLSARGEDYPGAGVGTDPMAMLALEFTQTIPWPGKRGLRTAAAAARVPEMAAAREAERRLLAADVREAWAMLYASGATISALRQALSLFDVLEPQALTRYETGLGSQADWLALRRERAMLASEIDRELGERTAVVARLAYALDDTTEARAATAAALPPTASSTADGASFAEVAMAEAGTETARRLRLAADREGRPDLVVGAEYGWRDSMAPMVTARVGLELPLWKGRKQDAMTRAAGHREAAARLGERDALLRSRAEAGALAARRDAALSAAARLRGQILPLLALTAESARARYLAGDGPADLLIEAFRDQAEARGRLAREEATAFAAQSRLLALDGRDPVAGNGKDAR